MAVDVSERVSANVNGALDRVLPIKLIDATTPALVVLCFSRSLTTTPTICPVLLYLLLNITSNSYGTIMEPYTWKNLYRRQRDHISCTHKSKVAALLIVGFKFGFSISRVFLLGGPPTRSSKIQPHNLFG